MRTMLTQTPGAVHYCTLSQCPIRDTGQGSASTKQAHGAFNICAGQIAPEGETEKLVKLQAYYGKLDAETVARYSLQCALNSHRGQAGNHGGEAFMLFNQVCPCLSSMRACKDDLTAMAAPA